MKECNKVKFDTEADAKLRLGIIKRNNPSCKLRNVYKCEICGAFHLTRMTKRNYIDGIKNGGVQLKKLIGRGVEIAKKNGWVDREE